MLRSIKTLSSIIANKGASAGSQGMIRGVHVDRRAHVGSSKWSKVAVFAFSFAWSKNVGVSTMNTV